MILKEAYLVNKVDSGNKDELNNPIYEDILTKVTFRNSGWASDEIISLGRKFTDLHSKIIIKTNDYDKIDNILIDGDRYEVERTITNHRWIVLYVKGYKL